MAFDYNKLKDPAYYEENRVPAHSDHAAFRSLQELKEGKTSFRYSLNGSWKFFYAMNEQQVIPGFESVEFDCRTWTDIVVPAHIQMEGYGVPQYCDTQYPWDGFQKAEPGELPERFNPVACYAKYFFLPDSLQDKRVFISFEGAESCIAVWLNGQYVGFASDSFTPSDFELTPYLVSGENKLACRVYRFSAGSWLESQDFMRFSGLFRDVFLYAKPEIHIEDISIRTDLDEAYKDAVLTGNVVVDTAKVNEAWQLLVELYDGENCIVREPQPHTGNCATFQIPVSNPKKWSSEKPDLYEVRLTLSTIDGEVNEVVSQKVGFRRFEIRDSVMLLNGQRIVFKGVNRHDYCAETGRATTTAKIRRDLINMKRNNINAVRTSHYPNQSILYSLCDELGLYVIDECNMETHGVWEMVAKGMKPMEFLLPGDREDWRDILLDRVNSMYQRDKNHACILIWSCGNESMGGTVILEMTRLFHSLDDTRPVHYEGVFNDPRYPETTDIMSQMYTTLAKIRETLSIERGKPFILCEYTHSMGNSNGGMHLYTEYAYEEPLYQGGFIWDYLDQATRGKDRYGNVIYNYGGDNGEQPHDGNFSGNGIFFADGEPTPKLQEVKYNYQNIVAEITNDTVVVHNRSMFTNTSEFDCVVSLARDGKTIEECTLETDVPPLAEKTYPVPFGRVVLPGEYTITVSFRLSTNTVWAERGYEVAFSQGIFTVEGSTDSRIRHEPLHVIYGTNNLGVHGECFDVLFSYKAGGLVSYRYAGIEMIREMPRPNFWRAPTDNDRGWYMPQKLGQWKLASMYAVRRLAMSAPFAGGFPPVQENEDGSVSILFEYTLSTTPEAFCSVRYTVHPCGTVDVTLNHDPVEGLPSMPEFGMLLKMDADYDHLQWYGKGPEENYWDRAEGARLGIFETDVRANMTHYLRPQECGNRTGVRWAKVTDYRGRGLRFEGDDMEFSALPYTPHEIENAQHAYELPPVHYTVIRAAMHQMGVAGDNSWGATPLPQYIIDTSKPLTFTFRFKGILESDS